MPGKQLFISRVKISDKKEGALNRGDISFVAAKYTPGAPAWTPLASEAFVKVAKKDLNKWLACTAYITSPSAPLMAGEVISLVLYEHDNKPQRTWTVDGNKTLHYDSKESEYGVVTLVYSTCVPSQAQTFNLTGASIEIKCVNG